MEDACYVGWLVGCAQRPEQAVADLVPDGDDRYVDVVGREGVAYFGCVVVDLPGEGLDVLCGPAFWGVLFFIMILINIMFSMSYVSTYVTLVNEKEKKNR